MPPRSDRPLTVLAGAAIVGYLLLLGSAWLLPAVSEFTLIGDHISELVLGRFGAVQTMAFVAAGIGTASLVLAVRALTAGSRWSAAGCVLLVVDAAALLLAAMFPTDRVDRPVEPSSLSSTGVIHLSAAAAGFVSLVAGMLVLTRAFAGQPDWRRLTVYSGLLAAAALSLLLGQTQGPLTGLMQRLLVTVITAWVIMVAARAWRLGAAVRRGADRRGIGRRLGVQTLPYGKFHPARSLGGPGNRRAR